MGKMLKHPQLSIKQYLQWVNENSDGMGVEILNVISWFYRNDETKIRKYMDETYNNIDKINETLPAMIKAVL